MRERKGSKNSILSPRFSEECPLNRGFLLNRCPLNELALYFKGDIRCPCKTKVSLNIFSSHFFSQAIPYYFPWLQVPVHWPHQFPDSWMASHYWTLPWLMRPATLCPTLQPSACLISTFSEGMSFRQLTFLTRKSGTFWMCWSQHAHHEVKADKRVLKIIFLGLVPAFQFKIMKTFDKIHTSIIISGYLTS